MGVGWIHGRYGVDTGCIQGGFRLSKGWIHMMDTWWMHKVETGWIPGGYMVDMGWVHGGYTIT